MLGLWDYALSVSDPILGTLSVDMEIVPQAIFGVSLEATARRELMKTHRKRLAEGEVLCCDFSGI